jgi:hypothetical protein
MQGRPNYDALEQRRLIFRREWLSGRLLFGIGQPQKLVGH